MKILIDINHPAHVHYFRNFIKIMEALGHSFVVTNRDDELINYLLDFYKIEHITRNKRKNNAGSKFQTLLYLIKMTYYVWHHARREKVDAFLGFGSSSCAISGFLLRKPSVILDDTEHNHLNHSIYKRFATVILTPFYFNKLIRKDQVTFDAYIEQLYLQKRDNKEKGNYIFIRFIAYSAGHDSKVNITELEEKREKLITLLSKNHELIISCEDDKLKEKYKSFQGNYKPEEMHEIMRKAQLVISEGATMASEAGIIGTPYIYTNPLMVGYIIEQEKNFNNCFILNYDKIIDMYKQDPNFFTKKIKNNNNQVYLNPTELLVWLFKDLSKHIKIIKGKNITASFFQKIQKN